MILLLESFQMKKNRLIGHILYLAIVFVLIPSFLYFELCIVLPSLIQQWSLTYFTHLFIATFLLLNIIGNMVYGMFTNTSIKSQVLTNSNQDNWTFCAVCECMRPPRAWHCNVCDICILKRDHHCTFFACCIGYYNQRYFILFTMYVFISMVYSFYYNLKFLALFVSWNYGLVIFKFIFPLAVFFIDFGYESFYIFLVVINVIVGIFTGFLFIYHFRNILQGKVVPETKEEGNDLSYDRGWKFNIIEVFGAKWYLTWISPFIHSPLPGNGIEWDLNEKLKEK